MEFLKNIVADLKENAIKAAAEFKAFERYEREKAHQKELQRLKERAIAKYGKNAWVEIESLKNKLEKVSRLVASLLSFYYL